MMNSVPPGVADVAAEDQAFVEQTGISARISAALQKALLLSPRPASPEAFAKVFSVFVCEDTQQLIGDTVTATEPSELAEGGEHKNDASDARAGGGTRMGGAADLVPAAAALVASHSMKPHPEGGFYAETYRSALSVTSSFGERSASTAITFLITPDSVSRLHRLEADEVWHFYEGGPMTVVELDREAGGNTRLTTLSQDTPQYVVPAGTWFGSFANEGSDYSFVGCTVSPGFEFSDFELGSRKALLDEFPGAADLVTKLTEGLP